MNLRFAACSLILGFFLMGTACSEKTVDKVGDAQHCLDEYAQNGGGNLDECESKISGVTTPGAFGIRCAIGYIREGFTTQTFVGAFQQIETVNATNVATFLNLLVFDAAGTTTSANLNTNAATAATVYDYCFQSQGKGATILATFTYLINSLYKYECDRSAQANCDQTSAVNFASALANGIALNTAVTVNFRTALGDVVVKTHSLSCLSGEANETLCNFLGRAITGAAIPNDPNEIGRRFLQVILAP